VDLGTNVIKRFTDLFSNFRNKLVSWQYFPALPNVFQIGQSLP